MDDGSLVALAKRGDEAAFRSLAERWEQRIFRFASGFFADRDEAGEITQKTLIRAYQKLSELDEPDAFPAWIYRIANNLCLDELKRAGRRRSRPLELWTRSDPASKESGPHENLETRELGEIIRKALRTLPEEQQSVILLKEFEGLKFREIAKTLDIPENTVKSRMYSGLKALRIKLNQWNISIDYLNHD
ncbi:MAG: sigma-70 family RNA polymerase sigma factor [Balneolaceae bacterium]|nr:sigma-70 family RNA polymerase sigma factor [Balneolaceae bacterium]MCH8549531.1 sigma-70 family RNA polymerase sigma factor [Balneolaceae bacterium]